MSGRGFTLVGGGARSGKSAFALRLAMKEGSRRLFVATAEAFDDEMRTRIDRHIAERGDAFTTLEAPHDLDTKMANLAAEEAPFDVVVIDCLTLWLSNLLLVETPLDAIEARVERLARTASSAAFRTILVTNEVGMGIVPDTALGRTFRDLTGSAHQRLARSASAICMAALGTILRLRPQPIALVEEGDAA